MHFCRVLFIAAQIGALLPVLAADEPENAVIPYKEIDQRWEVATSVNPSNLVGVITITSTNPAVTPSQIKMLVQTREGQAMVSLAPNGELRHFPHDPQLANQNPPIVSNQPKGSLRLKLTWKLPVSEYLGFHYSRLQDGVNEFNKAIKTQAGPMSAVLPRASGVIFVFPLASAGKAKVQIISGTDRREYVADARGQVKLDLDKTTPGNADVRLSEKADMIIPDVN